MAIITVRPTKPTALQILILQRHRPEDRFNLARVLKPGLRHFQIAELALVAGQIVVAMRRLPCYALSGTEEKDYGLDKKLSIRSLGLIIRFPYTRFLSLAIIGQISFSGALRWQIYKSSEAAETTKLAASMLSDFFTYSGYACLVAQLVIVPLAFRFVTPRYGLLIQPLAGLLSLFMLALSNTATGVFLSVVAFTYLKYTLNNCMLDSTSFR